MYGSGRLDVDCNKPASLKVFVTEKNYLDYHRLST